MGVFFYNIFLVLFRIGVRVASLFNFKAKKWVQGRHQVLGRLKAAIGRGDRVIWMHCASLGEFEQGRPLLEKIRSAYPGYKILLTFFSPSGFEIRKNYTGADWIFYLPMDSPRNAKQFLDIVHPSLAIFVKYEFWYYYLKTMKRRQIPLLLVSGIFREDMGFFKWYGQLQRSMLACFTHLFVQNKHSKDLVDGIGLSTRTSISGDTRFDRVIDIAAGATQIPIVDAFVGNKKTIVAGSTWPADESMLSEALGMLPDANVKLIIAPHEIHDEHIAQLKQLFPSHILYTEASVNHAEANVLIINNIGMLSRLYQYGYISYIGGGFGKGIHNTLEAAVYGKPVLFGPVYQKFAEATELLQLEGGYSVKTAEECSYVIKRLLEKESVQQEVGATARQYVYDNQGASEKIIAFIQENRLLTN